MCNHARRESPPEDAHHKRLRKDHARVPLQLQPKLVFLNQSDHQEALDIFARDHGKRSSRNDADSQTQDGEQFRVVLLCPSIIHTSSTMRHFTKYPFHLFMAFIPPGFWISLDDLSKKVDTILLLSAIGFVTIADAHELIGSAKDEKEFSWIGGEDGHIWSETARQALPAHKSLLRSTVAGQMVLGSWSSAKDALNATFGRPTALPDLQVGELDETESMGTPFGDVEFAISSYRIAPGSHLHCEHKTFTAICHLEFFISQNCQAIAGCQLRQGQHGTNLLTEKSFVPLEMQATMGIEFTNDFMYDELSKLLWYQLRPDFEVQIDREALQRTRAGQKLLREMRLIQSIVFVFSRT